MNRTPARTMRINDLFMDLTSHQVVRNNKVIDLTKKEYDLLEYLMQNKEMVLTREQILDKVWGYDYYGGTNVVDVYIKYLRDKIDEVVGCKLIHTIRGVGYILKEEAQ